MNEVDEIFGNAADDFLNSLGVPQASPTPNEQIETQAVVPVRTETVEIPQEEPATRELSESDIEEVLSEVGFTETLDAQYEDITDDEADLPDWENNGNPNLELEDNDEEYVHHYGRGEESEEEVNTHAEKNKGIIFPDVKTAPHANTVNWFYDGVKAMFSDNLLHVEDVIVLASLTTELAMHLWETKPIITNDDIDDMMASIQ